MSRHILRTCLIFVGALTCLSCSSANTDSSKFLSKALQDGKAEIRVCQLALQRSSSNDIKQFAQRMIDDHTRTDQEIQELATRKGVTLPADVSAEQKLTYDKLSALSGAGFDKEFMDHNVSDHEGDVKDFKEQADKGTDADVKAFAEKTLQMLQTHLELSKQVAAKVKA